MENISDNIEEIDEEYLVYRDLCLHPNIPTFYGLYFKPAKRIEEDQLWIVLEVSGEKLMKHILGSSPVCACCTCFTASINLYSHYPGRILVYTLFVTYSFALPLNSVCITSLNAIFSSNGHSLRSFL